MEGGSGYVSLEFGAHPPEWFNEFDVAKMIGIPRTELDDCDSVIVSQAKAKLYIEASIQNGHFKPKENQDGI